MKRLTQKKLTLHNAESYANPMENVANMVDVMMVLVVGLMLALIMNWNLDIETVAYKQETKIDKENALTFEDENMQEAKGETDQINDSEMEKLGTVYVDEATGKYYVIVDKAQ